MSASAAVGAHWRLRRPGPREAKPTGYGRRARWPRPAPSRWSSRAWRAAGPPHHRGRHGAHDRHRRLCRMRRPDPGQRRHARPVRGLQAEFVKRYAELAGTSRRRRGLCRGCARPPFPGPEHVYAGGGTGGERPPVTAAGVAHSVAELRAPPRLAADGLAGRLRADHGALHEGHLALVRAGARAQRPGGGLDLRQPDPVRAERGPEPLPARRGGRPRKLARRRRPSRLPPRRSRRCIRRVPAPGSRSTAGAGLCADRRPRHFRGVATVVTSCSTWSRPTSPCSARRTTSSSCSTSVSPATSPSDRDRGRTYVREQTASPFLAQPLSPARAPAHRLRRCSGCWRDPVATAHRGRLVGAAPRRGMRVGCCRPASPRSTMSSFVMPRRWPAGTRPRSLIGPPGCLAAAHLWQGPIDRQYHGHEDTHLGVDLKY